VTFPQQAFNGAAQKSSMVYHGNQGGPTMPINLEPSALPATPMGMRPLLQLQQGVEQELEDGRRVSC